MQVGTLHLVMSLEEAGPAALAPQPPTAPSPRRASPHKPQLQQPSSLAATPRYAADLPQPSLEAQLQLPAQPQLPAQHRTAHPVQQCSRQENSQPHDTEVALTTDVPVPSAAPNSSVQHAGSSASGAAIGADGASSRDAPGPTVSSSAGQPGVPAEPLEISQGHPYPVQRQSAAVAVQPPGIAADGPADAAPIAEATPLDAAVAGAQPPSTLEELVPEIEAAWELEMWKRAQEEQWRGELKRREAERMVCWVWGADVGCWLRCNCSPPVLHLLLLSMQRHSAQHPCILLSHLWEQQKSVLGWLTVMFALRDNPTSLGPPFLAARRVHWRRNGGGGRASVTQSMQPSARSLPPCRPRPSRC